MSIKDLVRKINDETLTFGEAICIEQRIYPYDATKLGLSYISQVLDEKLNETLIKKVRRKIVDTYLYNKDDPEFQIWIQKEKNIILERWKKTAPDYFNIIREYTPDIFDRRLIANTYSLRTNNVVSEKDKIVIEGRLPELLRTLIQDKIIDENEIDPPLELTYPTSNSQKKTLEDRISSGEPLDLVIGPVIKSKRRLLNLHSFPLLLDISEEKKESSTTITSKLASSKNLQEIIYQNQEYELVYLGENMGFIASVNHFPRGNRELADILKMTLAREDVEYEHTFEINGKKFELKPLKTYRSKHKTDIEVMDSNSDILKGANYLVVTNTSFDEFNTKYKEDFIATTQIFSRMFDGDRVFDTLKNLKEIIKNFNFEKYSVRLGEHVQLELKVQNFGGKFAFSLRSDCREFKMGNEEVLVMKNLLEYISELGIEYAMKIEGSEVSREIAKKKIKDREYAKNNLENIIHKLKDGGYSRAIGHAIRNNQTYILSSVGPSKNECMHCNRYYMTGSIAIKDSSSIHKEHKELLKTTLETMHILTSHPNLYPLTNDLEMISKLLSDSKDYKPTFIQTPEIISEMIEFAKISNKHQYYEAKSHELWWNTQGGIEGQYSKREIKRDNHLKYLLTKEKKLFNICRVYGQLEDILAQKLQEKYELLGGNSLAEKQSPSNFWANELLIYSAYQLGNNQLLLTNNTNKEIHSPEIPINFSITTYDGNF